MERMRFWPLPDIECMLCKHRKCAACREVSFSVAACCQCRSRAIARLEYLQKIAAENKRQDQKSK